MSTTKPESRKPWSRRPWAGEGRSGAHTSGAAPSGGPPARAVYRTRTAVVVWWAWLAFALINAVDLAIQWHHRAALVYAAVLALATGVAYVCALRPRMIADEAGVRIINPLRDCSVPWGAIRAVDVGEAVQVHVSLPDGTQKVVPSWAMYSSSRAQLKHDQRARKHAIQLSKRSPAYNQLPDDAKDMMGRSEAQLVAWQLDERAELARTAGAAAGPPTLAWAWLSVAAIAAPAIALVTLLLT